MMFYNFCNRYSLPTFLVELNLVSLLTSKLNIYSHFYEITISLCYELPGSKKEELLSFDMDNNFHLFNLFPAADLQVSG